MFTSLLELEAQLTQIHPTTIMRNSVEYYAVQVFNFSIYSSASKKIKKLNCCKFIKMVNCYLEPQVRFVAKY